MLENKPEDSPMKNLFLIFVIASLTSLTSSQSPLQENVDDLKTPPLYVPPMAKGPSSKVKLNLPAENMVGSIYKFT